MKKFNVKIMYTAFIVIGAGLIFYEQSKETSQNMFILAGGFAMLMFGLYKATTQWVKDNRKTAEENDEEQEFKN